MTTETRHTPVPWTLAAGGNIMAAAHFGFTVASTDTFTGNCVCPRPEREANGEFIVRAANAHDELLAHLKLLTTWMRRTSMRNTIGAVGEMLRDAEAAVAKAESDRL